ncbi:MAG: DUF4215 domain-containing protein [Candidatus Peregrinibacteria bacterium]
MSLSRFDRRLLPIIGILCVSSGIALAVFVSLVHSPTVPSERIPSPFSSISSFALKGSLVPTGIQGGRNTYDITFAETESGELLSGSGMYSVVIPDSVTISDGAPLSAAFSDKKFYGYRYSDIDASAEYAAAVAAQIALDQGDSVPFADFFPGEFFASNAMKADTAGHQFLSDFETNHSDVAASKLIRFHSFKDLTLKRNSRMIIVTLDADTAFTVRGVIWCGDGMTNGNERCDDGNTVDGDGCSTACTVDAATLRPDGRGSPLEEQYPPWNVFPAGTAVWDALNEPVDTPDRSNGVFVPLATDPSTVNMYTSTLTLTDPPANFLGPIKAGLIRLSWITPAGTANLMQSDYVVHFIDSVANTTALKQAKLYLYGYQANPTATMLRVNILGMTGSIITDPVSVDYSPREMRLAAAELILMKEDCGNPYTDACTESVNSCTIKGAGIVAFTPDGKKAYVVSPDSVSVSVISTDSNTVTSRIRVGSRPTAIAITPDGTMAFVANFYSESVSVISTASNTIIATVMVGENPTAIATSSDRAYVANNYGHSVSVIDINRIKDGPSHNPVIQTVVVGGNSYPSAIALSPDGTKVYIKITDNEFRLIGGGAVSAIGAPVTNGPIAITGTKVYISKSLQDAVAVTSTTATPGDIPLSVSVERNPTVIAITPDGKKAYVVNSSSDSVSVISTDSNMVTATVRVGSNPTAIAITLDGTKAYVLKNGSDMISVIDTESDTVKGSVLVGGGGDPSSIAITPDGTKAYVTVSGTNTIFIFDTSTDTPFGSDIVGTGNTCLNSCKVPTFPWIMDDSDSCFFITRGKSAVTEQAIGYRGNSTTFTAYAPTRLEGTAAVWEFFPIPVGQYRILATWKQLSGKPLSKTAAFTIVDHALLSYSSTADQSVAPPLLIDGTQWQELKSMWVNTGRLRIILENTPSQDPNSTLVADAVRIERIVEPIEDPQPPLPADPCTIGTVNEGVCPDQSRPIPRVTLSRSTIENTLEGINDGVTNSIRYVAVQTTQWQYGPFAQSDTPLSTVPDPEPTGDAAIMRDQMSFSKAFWARVQLFINGETSYTYIRLTRPASSNPWCEWAPDRMCKFDSRFEIATRLVSTLVPYIMIDVGGFQGAFNVSRKTTVSIGTVELIFDEPFCGNGDINNNPRVHEYCDEGKFCENKTKCESAAECAGIGDGLCATRASDTCAADCQNPMHLECLAFKLDGDVTRVVGMLSNYDKSKNTAWVTSLKRDTIYGPMGMITNVASTWDYLLGPLSFKNNGKFHLTIPTKWFNDEIGESYYNPPTLYVQSNQLYSSPRSSIGLYQYVPNSDYDECNTLSNCGDGVTDGSEECDRGHANGTDFCMAYADGDSCWTCRADCTKGLQKASGEYCGDGNVQPNGYDGIKGTDDDEVCDDENTNNEDDCTNNCRYSGHIVFVTADTYLGGQLGGVGGADGICKDVSMSAGYNGEWKAILSSSMSDARKRISVTYERIFNTRGTLIAEGSDEFWSANHRQSILTEYGESIATSNIRDIQDVVFSGTNSNGLRANGSQDGRLYCNDWGNAPYTSTYYYGRSYDIDADWIGAGSHPCTSPAHLYCFGSTAEPVCGNGIIDQREGCDAGAANGKECIPAYNGHCSYCNADCKKYTVVNGPSCGDGIVQEPQESCDDSNSIEDDGCDNACQSPGQTIFDFIPHTGAQAGQLGGLAGADRMCGERAAEAGLQGRWMAVLSDSTTNARDRIRIVGPVYNTRTIIGSHGERYERQLVARNAADFWDGALSAPIHFGASGDDTVQLHQPIARLTGTNPDGTRIANDSSALCGDWTMMTSARFNVGDMSATDASWVRNVSQTVGCDLFVSFYCMQTAEDAGG